MYFVWSSIVPIESYLIKAVLLCYVSLLVTQYLSLKEIS